jgi:hypothetical protein
LLGIQNTTCFLIRGQLTNISLSILERLIRLATDATTHHPDTTAYTFDATARQHLLSSIHADKSSISLIIDELVRIERITIRHGSIIGCGMTNGRRHTCFFLNGLPLTCKSLARTPHTTNSPHHHLDVTLGHTRLEEMCYPTLIGLQRYQLNCGQHPFRHTQANTE